MAEQMPLQSWLASEAWETLYLEGKRVPGVVRVEAKCPAGLDVKKAQGKKKARLADVGIPPTELEIDIELLPEELADFTATIRVIRPPSSGESRVPIKIDHPQAALWGVSRVIIGDIKSRPPEPGGTIKVSFLAVEYRQPSAVKKKAAPATKQQGEEGWNIDDELMSLDPAQNGAVQENFSAPRDFSGVFDPVTPPGP